MDTSSNDNSIPTKQTMWSKFDLNAELLRQADCYSTQSLVSLGHLLGWALSDLGTFRQRLKTLNKLIVMLIKQL